MRSRLARLCMIVLLGVWTGIGCARHVVVERDAVQTLNQTDWTILSTPDTAEDGKGAARQRELEADPIP